MFLNSENNKEQITLRRFSTLKLMRAHLGGSNENHEKWLALLEAVQAHFVEKGDVNVRVHWDNIEAAVELRLKEKRSTEVIQPDDFFLPEKDYIAVHGNPDTNNEGHRRAVIDSMSVVMMPSADKLWRVRRKHGLEASMERPIVKSTDGFGVDQMAMTFNELADGFIAVRATGSAVHRSGSGEAPVERAPSQPVLSCSSWETPLGFGFNVSTQIGQRVPETPEQAPHQSPTKRMSPEAPALPGLPQVGGSPGDGQPRNKTRRTQKEQTSEQAAKEPKARGGGKGRPKRDLLMDIEKILKEFESAAQNDPLYFGSEYKTRERYMKRLDADVETVLTSVTDLGIFNKLAGARKCLQVVLAITKAMKEHGDQSKAFQLVFNNQVQYLDMDPRVPLRFTLCAVFFSINFFDI